MFFEKQNGIFYLTQKFIEQNFERKNFKEIWQQSYLVIDEFDWLLFEGQPETMLKWV